MNMLEKQYTHNGKFDDKLRKSIYIYPISEFRLKKSLESAISQFLAQVGRVPGTTHVFYLA